MHMLTNLLFGKAHILAVMGSLCSSLLDDVE